MEYKEARDKFIQAWGSLGSSWGINRTMAQIHALLLISPGPLSAEQIMEDLNISRGNVNMNLRALMDWGIVYKELRSGERREYFYSEKDIWAVATRVAKERRKRELEPVIRVLNQVKQIEGNKSKDAIEFKKVTGDLADFAKNAESMIDTFVKAEENWFLSKFFKLLK